METDGEGETMERTYTLMLVEDERNILYGMKNAILCHNALVSEILTAENGREVPSWSAGSVNRGMRCP